MDNDFKTAISLLRQGQAPGNREILKQITVRVDSATDFIDHKYLEEYIALGGGKVKFVTGRAGSGKTHFLQLITSAAKDRGFVTVDFSAKDIWLHDFKEIYAEVFKRCDLIRCLSRCAEKIITELGYETASLPPGLSFVDYLSSMGELDALIKREIRSQLQSMFLKNPLIDNNFAIACSLLTGGILGHPVLEGSNRDLLLSWLSANKDIKLASVRKLGLSPTKITKFNARHMLRSLAEVHRLASVPGIVVVIDNVDILVNSTSLDTIRYTKLKREDAYESIRELIDEIDTLKNIMFLFAFDKRLIDDELSGIKSYQALWMRIQNEIVSSRFNGFTDIIDLDRFGTEAYGKQTLLGMSEKIAAAVNMAYSNASPIDDETTEEIMAKAQFAKTALPRQVVFATVSAGKKAGQDDGAGPATEDSL